MVVIIGLSCFLLHGTFNNVEMGGFQKKTEWVMEFPKLISVLQSRLSKTAHSLKAIPKQYFRNRNGTWRNGKKARGRRHPLPHDRGERGGGLDQEVHPEHSWAGWAQHGCLLCQLGAWNVVLVTMCAFVGVDI